MTNAVSISSARTTKRFPSSRCASAIQIVCPLESIADSTAPTPTGFAEIVSDDFPNTARAAVIRVYDEAGNVIETHEHAGESKEP